ncbi:hypothetical protein W97_03193 [Coniosporium apollinis CBS 100218]|uniref:Palmitoyltransferase n=1 Tax=Coniosporium apollinis (strain CBS 100218) TaxID=1168221 RepID=R7YQ68_CONA1|nr:uncharacterized protein W97_03193 [Coniosporium apollinis CBS 100218]EON63964.1 hypothetical protein W97_03193 [Coniosporium apollinis CBS 100218]
MATLGSPSPPRSPNRRRSWARKCERYCCNVVTYLPLGFVYGLTTWAVWVEAGMGIEGSRGWTGYFSSALGILFYILLNWSYTVAVFTDPGSPLTSKQGYSHLPTDEPRAYTSFTVKSSGDIRFCKKCQTKKPDRAHHCSSCKRCVLKMDHHCPWLATCVGLRNYKPFLLFLIYVSLFCWVCFAASASWVWTEMVSDANFADTLMPVNYILLAVISGIIGLVITGFTAWHIMLACKGRTTIESLEKTRYISPLRKAMQQSFAASDAGRGYPDHDQRRGSFTDGLHNLGEQLREIHANALPGVTRPEEGEDSRPDSRAHSRSPYPTSSDASTSSPAHHSLRTSYAQLERRRERDRYAEYLEEQDSDALPNAFDLGWKRNLLHVLGPVPALWFLPICNTTGDGWQWEASREWVAAREGIRRRREAEMRRQEERERAAGWGENITSTGGGGGYGYGYPPPRQPPAWRQEGLNWDDREDGGGERRFLTTTNGVTAVPTSGRRSPGKADSILGRSPGQFVDGSPGSPQAGGPLMQALDRRKQTQEDEDGYDSSSGEEGTDAKTLLRGGNGRGGTENWNDVPEDFLPAGARRG